MSLRSLLACIFILSLSACASASTTYLEHIDKYILASEQGNCKILNEPTVLGNGKLVKSNESFFAVSKRHLGSYEVLVDIGLNQDNKCNVIIKGKPVLKSEIVSLLCKGNWTVELFHIGGNDYDLKFLPL